MSLEGEDDDNPILSFKTTRKSNRNNISSIYNEQKMMIPWSDRRHEKMRYRDDDGSRTMQRRRQRQIGDDARAQTTTDRGWCKGADDDGQQYRGETEKTDGDTETTAQLCRRWRQNLQKVFKMFLFYYLII